MEFQTKRPLFKHLRQTFKKLVSVLATSAPINKASKKDDVALKKVLCIHYPIRLKKNKIKALINSSSEINAMFLRYASKIGLKVGHINDWAQKINGSTLKMFILALAGLWVEDK